MIYITGDKHGNFNEIKKFCQENYITKDDFIFKKIGGQNCPSFYI